MSYYGANHYTANHYGSNYYGPQGAVVEPEVPIRGGGGAADARRRQIAEDDLIMNMVMDKFLEITNAKRL